MAHKFNIVQVKPESATEYFHTQCFLEIAYLLRYALQDLGFVVEFTGQLQHESLNIILGYHALNGRRLPAEYNCIIYQLEELSPQIIKLDELISTLRSPCIIWDFNEQNVEYLNQLGIKAILKPLGFHPKMEVMEYNTDKDIDILFYGSMNDRRKRILDELAKHFEIKTLFGVYGKERDQWLARSKIVLSVYYFETRYFDDVRLSYLMNNRIFTIVEDTPYRKYEDLLIYAPYQKLVELCGFYLENDDLRQQQVNKVFEGFSQFPETGFLQSALLLNSEAKVTHEI